MYLGNTPTQQAFSPAVDYFSGNGSTTAFTLSRSVASVAQVEAVIENVVQSPVDAYTISGNTITFTSAPPAGSNNIYVRYTSPITQVMQPSDGSVGLRQLNSDVQGALYGFKNRIINGAMAVNQRGTLDTPVTANDATYGADRFKMSMVASSKGTIQQSSTAPAGFKNSLLFTSSAATSVGSTDYYSIVQPIEGLNILDLGWGAVGAATVTLSFWVRSSLTGTFGGSIQNSGTSRSYPFSYTINSANTFEQKTVTIAGDTTGTWLTTNGIGIQVRFSLGMGSTYSGTANAWVSGDYESVTGATSVVGTNGATFYITGVQLEKGTTATSFDYRPYGAELALCQRYYWKFSGTTNTGIGSGVCNGSGANNANIFVKHPVSMRSAPTFSQSSTVMNLGTVSNTVTGIVGTYASFDSSLVQISAASGCVANSGATWLINSGYIDATAEL